MANIKPKTNGSDFDADAMVQEHQKGITDLQERIKALEDKFGTNEAIAETLTNVEENSVKMQTLLASCIVKQINQHPDVRKAIKDKVDEVDRNAFFSFIKRLWIGIWALILAAIAGGLGYFLGLVHSSTPK